MLLTGLLNLTRSIISIALNGLGVLPWPPALFGVLADITLCALRLQESAEKNIFIKIFSSTDFIFWVIDIDIKSKATSAI